MCPRRAFAFPAAAWPLALLLATACASPRPAPPTGPAAAPAAVAPAAPPPSAGERVLAKRMDDIPSAPPDGKWLTDEEGHRYFVHEIPKIEGFYKVIDEGRQVQIHYGFRLRIDRETPDSFFIRVYAVEPRVAPAVRRPPTAAELAASAKGYVVKLDEVDRLELSPWEAGLPVTGQWRNGFDLGDFDGDGQLDIVHGPPRKQPGTAVIYLGDGKGGWRRWAAARFRQSGLDYGDAKAADFNGDGVLDVAFACHLRGIVVLVGDGRGDFRPWSAGIGFATGKPGESAFSSRALAVVDWNRDGRPDLLALGEGPQLGVARTGEIDKQHPYAQGSRAVVVYLNQGDGTWVGAPQPGTGFFGDDVLVSDLNRDELPDFAVAASAVGVTDILHFGTADGGSRVEQIAELRPGILVRAVAAADFDGDGRGDLAVGYLNVDLNVWRTGVDVFLGRADGRWERRALHAEDSQTGVFAVAAGDLDGDRARDLAAFTGDGRAWIFLGDGHGGFRLEREPGAASREPGCGGYHAVLHDLDGDGRDELLAGFAGEDSRGPFQFLIPEPICTSGGSLRVWKAARR